MLLVGTPRLNYHEGTPKCNSIEKIMFIPMKSGAKIAYNAKKDDLLVFVYDCDEAA